MTIEEMKQRKKELGYSNEQLAALSGIPLGTIMKIFGGATKSPRRATIEALERILSPAARYRYPPYHSGLQGQDPSGSDLYPSEYSPRFLRESSSSYEYTQRMDQGHVDPYRLDKPHHLYTMEDYYALPDDIRTELIDGVFYDMASPSLTHQLVIGELYLQFKACEKKHGGKCRVILSPSDVQLDKDRYTMVQPDLLVVCDPDRLTERSCYGAPDLCVEVLSSSSRSHDCVLKLSKYKNAGVREYWIVDPEHRQVITYDFSDPSGPTFETYTFSDEIPIRISGGECSVNMKDVLEGLAR